MTARPDTSGRRTRLGVVAVAPFEALPRPLAEIDKALTSARNTRRQVVGEIDRLEVAGTEAWREADGYRENLTELDAAIDEMLDQRAQAARLLEAPAS